MISTDAGNERFMKRCLELAIQARDAGNTPVGSVVVLEGQIIGEGVEQLPVGTVITGHAEILACQQAVDTIGRRLLTGAALYSTAEPCFMCSYVIRQSQIARVAFALETPTIGGATSGFPILTDETLTPWKPPVDVQSGLLADECRQMRRSP